MGNCKATSETFESLRTEGKYLKQRVLYFPTVTSEHS
jgi:hypothetical protein